MLPVAQVRVEEMLVISALEGGRVVQASYSAPSFFLSLCLLFLRVGHLSPGHGQA